MSPRWLVSAWYIVVLVMAGSVATRDDNFTKYRVIHNDDVTSYLWRCLSSTASTPLYSFSTYSTTDAKTFKKTSKVGNNMKFILCHAQNNKQEAKNIDTGWITKATFWVYRQNRCNFFLRHKQFVKTMSIKLWGRWIWNGFSISNYSCVYNLT